MEIVKFDPSQGGKGQRHALTIVGNGSTAQEIKPFIEANTTRITLDEIRNKHVIPVFTRDNEPLISHVDFVQAALSSVRQVFRAEKINTPQVRVSHPVKGRIPEARNKPANQLEEWEQTLYYERMAFVIEIPTISDNVGGETLHLVVGGVKAYNLDNLSNKKGASEHFKVFIGYKVKVCTNLCVWSDGLIKDLRVSCMEHLERSIHDLISEYDAITCIRGIDRLANYSLTESRFAQLIGKCKLYHYLPSTIKGTIYDLQFGDSHINTVARDYYKDKSFCKDPDGNINLWKLYNLFTGANKSSYIDSFLERAANASALVDELAYALERQTYNWFLA